MPCRHNDRKSHLGNITPAFLLGGWRPCLSHFQKPRGNASVSAPLSLTFPPGFASPELSFSTVEASELGDSACKLRNGPSAPYTQVPASCCSSGTVPWNPGCLDGGEVFPIPAGGSLPQSGMGWETMDRSLPLLGPHLPTSNTRKSGPGSDQWGS